MLVLAALVLVEQVLLVLLLDDVLSESGAPVGSPAEYAARATARASPREQSPAKGGALNG